MAARGAREAKAREQGQAGAPAAGSKRAREKSRRA